MSRRILVVDDEAHIVQVLSLKLRNAGYQVITAVDGEEALEIVRSLAAQHAGGPGDKSSAAKGPHSPSKANGDPDQWSAVSVQATTNTPDPTLNSAQRAAVDLIITDFQMPYMSGLELCKSLAGDPATSAIPVLMLTARGYALDPEDLAIGNIRDVLSKPFSPRAMVDQIQRILGQAGEGDPDSSGLGIASEAA